MGKCKMANGSMLLRYSSKRTADENPAVSTQAFAYKSYKCKVCKGWHIRQATNGK